MNQWSRKSNVDSINFSSVFYSASKEYQHGPLLLDEVLIVENNTFVYR